MYFDNIPNAGYNLGEGRKQAPHNNILKLRKVCQVPSLRISWVS